MKEISRSVVATLAVLAAVAAQPAAGGPSAPAPGPLRLVFESNRTGTWQVYSVPAAGGAIAQLTFAAAGSRNPRPSPDGRTLLVDRAGGIWLLQANGTQPRRLVAGRSAAWTRDGRRFAYVGPAARPGIHVYELRTRRSRRVTSQPTDTQPSWSPDGRSLLVRRAGTSLVVLRGGRSRTVAIDATAAAWSPDGRWIAYTHRTSGDAAGVWRLVLVRPDGTGARLLAAGLFGGAALAWSPDRRSIALADGTIVDARTGAVRRRASIDATEVAWSPRGDSLAALARRWPRTDLLALPAAGPARLLLAGGDVDDQRSLAWTRPPRGTRFRSSQPPSPLQVASARELRARVPLLGIGADGARVAYELCGVSTWQPGGVLAGPTDSAECSSAARSARGGVGKVTLAGDRIAYAAAGGGNSRWAALHVARVDAPWPGAQIASAGGSWQDTCCSPLLPRLGYVLGDGPLVVFSTWTVDSCEAGPPWERCFDSQTVWRVGASGAPEEVATGGGTLEPVSVDSARVVVRRANGEIALLTERGEPLLALPLAPGNALAAELSGRDLAVVVPGELRHYDAGTGQLLRSWPLPHVPAGGFCGLWSACDSLDLLLGARVLVLEDLARGIVAYRLHGELLLKRLRDGAEASLGPAISARLEDEGLFYSYRGDENWPGRIRFVPFDELPLGP